MNAYEIAQKYMSGEINDVNGNAREVARMWGESEHFKGKLKFVREFDSKNLSGVDADAVTWLKGLRDDYEQEIVTYHSFLFWISAQAHYIGLG